MLTVLRRSAGTSRVEVIDGAASGRLEAGPHRANAVMHATSSWGAILVVTTTVLPTRVWL